ncbi:MAG TPA: xylulokinase [Acidimicrobiia bacterium]|nr:xylulokinase [Acidimicrobiia bacterium]
MSHFLGIDVSTTATKALLLDGDGVVVSEGISSYSFDSPRPTWAEQDPHVWWDAAGEAIRSAVADAGIETTAIDAVGLTGQMHGSVLLDVSGEVVRPAILWNDQRTAAECDQIREMVGREHLIATTGNDALTGFTAPKLLWVANHEPENWERVATIMLPKDYVRFGLTGERAVDAADGSGTILFDLGQRTWSTDILTELDLDPAICPPVYEGPQVTGTVSAAAAGVTGLRTGTPVVAGGGDQSANAVGVGAVEPGVFALSLGTSGVVFATSDGVAIEPEGRLHSFCHAVPGKWHMMGVMLSAAGSLRWLRDALAPHLSYEELMTEAAQVPPGSEGLWFLPYLSGERTPHSDPLARGAFIGLTSSHDLAHLTRAVLEGVAFGLRDGFDLMIDSGLAPPDSVRGSGGGLRSRLWTQVLADVLGVAISKVSTDEGAAYGAAILAAVGAGNFESVEAATKSLVSVTETMEPSGDVDFYVQAHAGYQDLYPALRPTFHRTGS